MKKLILSFLLSCALLVGLSGVAVAAPNEHANEHAHHNKDADHGANRDGDFTAQDPPVQDTSNDHGNRPSDGSVGNADDKNPPGQSHHPEDSNKGYECDDNNGVGHGNPAHSACAPTTTTTERHVTTTTEGPKVHHFPHPRLKDDVKLVPPVVLERPAPTTTVRSIPVTRAVPTAPALAVTGNDSNGSLVVSGLVLIFLGGLLLLALRHRD